MTIAFFTALKEESLAVRKAWQMVDSGSLKGLPLHTGERAICVTTGVGAHRMTAAVEQTLHIFGPKVAVLIGFSAGLRRDLTVGEVICDDRGDTELIGALRAFPVPLRFGRVAASGFLHSAADKQALALQSPDCLVADMESLAFMEAAASVPHLVVRAISDDLDTTLPLKFDELLNSRGFPDELSIAKKLLKNPGKIPQVWSLAQASATAQDALAETVRDIKPLLVRRLLEAN